MDIVLSNEQVCALEQINNWWISSSRFFILQGRAGSGKTLITKKVLDNLTNCYPLLTAPTNAAVRQIEKYFPTLFDVKTTFSALGFHFDTKQEKKVLTRIGTPSSINDYNLLLVDEASFIGDSKQCLTSGGYISIFDALMELDLKILFVGHRSQLPEVTEGKVELESPIFQQGWPTIELTQIQRNQGNLTNYINYLESLIYLTNKRWDNKYPFSELQTIKFLKSKEGMEAFLEGKTKIIGYTNAVVDQYNKQIRKNLFKVDEDFLEGDNIILTEPSTYIGKIDHLTEKQIYFLFNKNKLSYSANTEFKILSKKFTYLLGVYSSELKVQNDDGVGLLYVPIDLEKFNKLKLRLKLEALNKVTQVAKEKAWKYYHSIMSLFTLDWKYSYALTTHRVQGANIDFPIVLWNDIKTCRNTTLRSKLLYVAASRARVDLRIRE